MAKKRINLSEINLNTVNKQANSNFADCNVEELMGALAVTKAFETKTAKLYVKTKRHIETTLKPEDIEGVLEKTEDGTKFEAEVVAVDTLFGTEYLLGGCKWIISGNKKGMSAKDILIKVATDNPEIKDALEQRGILRLEYVVDYDKIHGIVDSLRSKAEIPYDVAILGEVCELVETEHTVRVSTIKENFKEEDDYL